MKRIWVVWVLVLAFLLSETAMAEKPILDSDMGTIQIVSPGDSAPAEPQDLSDLKLGQIYSLPGCAKVKPMSFGYVDSIAQYAEGADLSLKKWISFGRNGGGDIVLDGFDDKTRTQMHNYVLLIGAETEVDPKDRSDLGLSKYLEGHNNSWGYVKATTFIPDCAWLESGINAEFACIDFEFVNMKGAETDLTKNAEVIVNYDGAQYRGWFRKVNDYMGPVYRYCVTDNMPHYKYAVISPNDATPLTTGQAGTYVVGATLPNIAIEEENTPLSITLVIDGYELTYNIR